MNEIIPIVNDRSNRPTVMGRELHRALNLKSNYSTWFKRMCEYDFIEGEDFFPLLEKSTGGRPETDHQLTLSMAKEICMIQRSEIGKKCRRYFIEVERRFRAEHKDAELEFRPNQDALRHSGAPEIDYRECLEKDYSNLEPLTYVPPLPDRIILKEMYKDFQRYADVVRELSEKLEKQGILIDFLMHKSRL